MAATPSPTPRQGMLGGVFLTLVAEGIGLPAGLITAMVMTRGLGPGIYGRFMVVASTVAITEWLLIAVLARPIVKFVAEADDWRPVAATSFRVYVLSGLVIGGALWALAGPLAALLDDALLAGYFRLFAVQIPIFAAGAACRNVLAGQARYRQQAMASALGWVGRVLFIVLFLQLGFGIEGAILGSICGTLASALTALLLVGGAVWGQAGFPIRQLMQLALPTFLGLLFARLLDQAGLLTLQALGTAEADVGFYGAAMNVMLVTSVIAAGVTPVLISTLTAARRDSDHALIRQAATGAMRFGIALFPFAAIVAGSSGELAVLLFSRDFSATAPIMAALMVAAVARATVSMMGAVLVALDRAWASAFVVLPLPLLAVGAHVLLIPKYGGLGVALVTMTLAIAASVASVLIASRLVRAPVPLGTLMRSGAITTLAYALAAGWPTPGPLVLVKAGILALAVALAFAASGELTRHELAVLRETALAGRGRPAA